MNATLPALLDSLDETIARQSRLHRLHREQTDHLERCVGALTQARTLAARGELTSDQDAAVKAAVLERGLLAGREPQLALIAAFPPEETTA